MLGEANWTYYKIYIYKRKGLCEFLGEELVVGGGVYVATAVS